MEEENFNFEAWEKELERIEKGESSTTNFQPKMEIKQEIKEENKEETYFDHFKQLTTKSTGKVKLSGFPGVTLNRSTQSSHYLSSIKLYDCIIRDIKIDEVKKNISSFILILYDEDLDFYYEQSVVDYNFKHSLLDNLKTDRLFIFSNISNDEEIYNKKLLIYEEMVKNENDLRSENLIKALNKNNEELYKKALDAYTIKKNLANILTTFEKCCNLVFEDNWDLETDINSREEYIPNSQFNTRLTIYFPEITIKNSKNKEHFIKDFYLSVFFNKEFKIFTTLYGRRGLYTLEEFNTRYAHSHCSPDNYAWSSMCVGSDTPISNFIYDLASSSIPIDEPKLMKLLLLIKGYVDWESLEGMPHIRMETIPKNSTTITINFNELEVDSCYKTIKNSLNKIDHTNLVVFNKVNNFNVFNFNKEKLAEELSKVQFNRNESYYKCFKTGDNYFSLNSDPIRYATDIRRANDNIRGNTNSYQRIFFKGRVFLPKVVENINASNGEAKECLNPYLFDKIEALLKIELNKYYLKTHKYEFSSIAQSA